MKHWLALLFILFILLPAVCLAQPDRSEKIAELMIGIESVSQTQRVNAAKIISRSGLQDQELYAKLAAILEAGYRRPYEKDHADEMAWICKALAASGNSGYITALKALHDETDNGKLKTYTKKAIRALN